MKIYLVITIFAVLVSVALCRPGGIGRDVVEIQKQRLVKLASDSPRYQSNAETPETQRILQEIERINLAMGYKKRQQPMPVQRSNIQLDYFYPREEYRPFVLQRSSMLNRGSARYQNQAYHRARKITHKHSVLMPNPFNTQSYFYPAPYLQTPSNEPPKLFRINEQVYSITPVNLNFNKPEKSTTSKVNTTNAPIQEAASVAPLSFLPLRLEDIPQFLLGGPYSIAKDSVSVIEYLPNAIDDHPELDNLDNLRLSKARVTNEQKNQLVNSIRKIVDSAKQTKRKILTTTETSILDDIIDEIADDYLDEEVIKKNKKNQEANIVAPTTTTTTTTTGIPPMEPLSATTVSTLSQPIVVEPIDPENPDYETAIELLTDSNESVDSESESIESESEEEDDTSSAQKTFPSFISSPPGAKLKPTSNGIRLPSPPNLGFPKPSNANSLKSPLGNIFGITDHTKEALREGGIVIQRLKVRRGGIAIAGPGGVATAGSGGTAIVGPGGVALTHPRSLAIAGPGAKVIALPETADLEQLALSSSPRHLPLEGTLVATGPVVYYRAPLEHRADDIITLPYYGGAKGQVLQIRQKPDGSVVSEIVQHPINDQIQDVASKAEKIEKPEESFEFNLKTIQKAAAVLVNLQHNIKAAGKLTDEDQKLYSENLEKLGVSAQKLAHIQSDTGTDDFRLLFQNPLVSRIPDTIKGAIDKIENNKKPPKKEEEEENVGEESDKEDNEDKDSVQVNTPDKDASVAEAKPVGLAIAGEGGVASSKPVATAVVGPGGLAVARPVATAIAGIEPSQVSQLGIPLPTKVRPNLLSRVSFPLRKKYGFDDEGLEDGIGLLVGPGYRPQTRSVSQREIDAFMEEQSLNKEVAPEDLIEPKSDDAAPEEMYELAVAPETMLPNRYPLMPPNFGGYVSQMARWESDGVIPSTGFNPIAFQQNRAIRHEPQILPVNPQNPFRIFVY